MAILIIISIVVFAAFCASFKMSSMCSRDEEKRQLEKEFENQLIK